MEATPPVMWFMRREMRRRRGALSLPRFRTLVRVEKGDAGVSAVAEHLGTSVPTASRIVAGLVGRGFIARRPLQNDGRRMALVVTDKGRHALDGARAGTLIRLESELATLSAADRAVVIAAMELLRQIFAPLVGARTAGSESPAGAAPRGPAKERRRAS